MQTILLTFIGRISIFLSSDSSVITPAWLDPRQSEI